MRLLYSAGELRDEIAKVLGDPEPEDRRVVLVAFVGGEAQEFLPDPKGLEIVCWLQPPTNALTLDRLKKRGAEIYKSDHLHMKVYWSSRCGCVTVHRRSANRLSSYGMKKATSDALPNRLG